MRTRIFWSALVLTVGLVGASSAEWLSQETHCSYYATKTQERHPISKVIPMVATSEFATGSHVCISYQNSLHETPFRGRVKASIEVTRFDEATHTSQTEVLRIRERVYRNRAFDCDFISAPLRSGDLITATVKFQNFPKLHHANRSGDSFRIALAIHSHTN